MQIPEHKIDEEKLFIKWRNIKIEPDAKEHAHRHNYFQFMCLTKAVGHHEIDFEHYEASDASLHFVGKGRVHKVDFAEDVHGGVLVFPEVLFGSSESDMKLLASLSFFDNGAYPILNLSKTDFKIIMTLVDQIKSSLDALEMCRHLLFALLLKVRSIYNEAGGTAAVKKIPKEIILFKELLKKHSNEWNTVDDFTKEIGITNLRLNNFCKSHYGKTALQVLHDKKILEAKRKLVYTDKQVKGIAYECGFEDVAYFNRFFKKHTDCTPLSFRKKH